MPNGQPLTAQQLRFRLLQRAHSFEKALSLPKVTTRFGIPKFRELLTLISNYRRQGLPMDGPEILMALNACRSYVDFHLAHAIDITREFPEFDPSIHLPPPGHGPSILNKTSDELIVSAKGDFESLALSRCSVRQFAEQPVDPCLIRDAVRIAQKCPSVCNRQTAHAWLLQNHETVQKVLRVQQGSKGFSQQIHTVIAITSSLECFDGSKERNQGFIDGGLFAMSLMHALHFKGLAVCPLNWSSGRAKDRALRQTIPIPDSHIVIMLLAVGHYPKSFPVATSPRRHLDEVLSIIGH